MCAGSELRTSGRTAAIDALFVACSGAWQASSGRAILRVCCESTNPHSMRMHVHWVTVSDIRQDSSNRRSVCGVSCYTDKRFVVKAARN